MADDGAVKVVVRVRPMNTREVERNAKLIVKMQQKQTVLYTKGDGSADDHEKKFTFDHSYWSYDKKDANYATQEQVFADLGGDVINSAFTGYNACVFAYGQTGSGKSYTMMGYGEDTGLIPRICEGIFQRVSASPDDVEFNATVSYLEIYNERVKDLLAEKSKKKGVDEHNLKVREHPQTGPYVEGLQTKAVADFEEIEKLMELGNINRTTAATNMNDTSSRSHAIFTFTLSQASFIEGVPAEKSSKLNLVDLAGSERTSSTGATGLRLREGGNINKSLTTLGLVISALAERSGSPKKKGKHIPYRDSVLTWLLKDSLGGNSKTIMVAAISPADINHGETLSTLHYANRAKNIVNKPIVNEDPNVRLIKELRGEVQRLKDLLGGDEKIAEAQERADAAKAKLAAASTTEEKEAAQAEIDQAEKDLTSTTSKQDAARAQIAMSEKMMSELTNSWQSKWQGQSKIMEDRGMVVKDQGRAVHVHSEKPHLVMLSGDDSLATGITIYYLEEKMSRVGANGAEPPPDIGLTGAGIEDEHCILECMDDETKNVVLHPSGDLCYVNGKKVSETTILYQGAQVQLGHHTIFRFNHPSQAEMLKKMRESGEIIPPNLMSSCSTPLPLDVLSVNDETEKLKEATEELERFKLEMEEERLAEAARRASEDAARLEQEAKEKEELQARLAKLEAMVAEKDDQVKSLTEVSTEAQAKLEEAKRLEEEARIEREAQLAAAEREKEEARLKADAIAQEAREQQELLALEATRNREELLKLEQQKQQELMEEWQENLQKLQLQAEEAQAKAAKEAEARAKVEMTAAEEARKRIEEVKAAQALASQNSKAAEEERKRLAQLESHAKKLQQTANEANLRAAQAQEIEKKKRQKEIDEMQKKLQEKERPFSEVWKLSVPRFQRRGDVTSGSTYIAYEVKITLGGETWKIIRRYREFHQFHVEMKNLLPGVVSRIKFPPKKALWRHDDQFHRQRRQDLEDYLVKLVSSLYLNQASPFYNTDRHALEKKVPFFRPGESLRRV